MAVTKRIRYEVLRRDNHTCRYCHATDSPLTVDHVTPVALGGSNDPSNLVAACKDCNAGKSSASPDSTLVAEVADDAIRHAEMIRQAYSVLVGRIGARDDYMAEVFNSLWEPLPDDWRVTVSRWFAMGVPVELVVDAADIATMKASQFRTGYAQFSYMCGIVWKQVHAVTETVTAKSALDGSFMSDDAIQKLMSDEYAQGRWTGSRLAFERWAPADVLTRLLRSVVDRSTSQFVTDWEANIGAHLEQMRARTPEGLAKAGF